MSARLTRAQRTALDMVKRADPGEVYLVTCASFTESGSNLGNPWTQAFIHWRAANNLARLGLVRIEGNGEDAKVYPIDTDAPCPVSFCRSWADHRGLHDIRACTRDCGPIVDGQPRAWHSDECPNGQWLAARAASQDPASAANATTEGRSEVSAHCDAGGAQ